MQLWSTMERIGVRKLRQHASRYRARVVTGETIDVPTMRTSITPSTPQLG
jgi:hypothetical protein